MQTLKRKWQNFKTHRQLQELWQDYKAKCPVSGSISSQNPSDLQSLFDFLESLKTAVQQIESSSGREAQIDGIFGDSEELLLILTSFLQDADFLKSMSSSLPLIYKTIELLTRSPKSKPQTESPKLHSIILSGLDDSENEENLLWLLKILQNFSLSDKREACSSGLILKVLQLLMNKNEEIVKETLSTIKFFIESTALDQRNEKSFRKKLSSILGGVTKFAWSFFPNEELSRSNDGISEENEDVVSFPPQEVALRNAAGHFQRKFSMVEEVEQAISAGNSPIKEEIKAEVVVEEFLSVKGTVTVISKALLMASDWVKLELVTLLYILLAQNVANQKEFKKVDGYMVLAQGVCKIDLTCEKGVKILQNCFKVIGSIILNSKNSKEIGNLSALKMLLQIAASSNSTLIVRNSIDLLRSLINENWENVVCLYDIGVDYLTPVLEKNSLIIEKNLENEETFQVIDDTLKYISFLLGNAWEKNVDILKVYSSVVENHASNLQESILNRLVTSMCGVIADINTRCNQRNSLLRSTFLSCFEGMRLAASASLRVFETNVELSILLIAHLLEYELLYTETLLSTPLSQDTFNTLYSINLVDIFKKIYLKGNSGIWVYEKFLVTKSFCDGIEAELFSLIEQNELLLVIKVLMMEEYPNIDKFRSKRIRENFLSEKGICVIREGLPAVEYLWLMMAASKNSAELKLLISKSIELKDLALKIPTTIDSFNILFELATIGGYLEASDYYGKISSSLPSISNDFILQVTQPHYLFNPISLSHRSSTATSTLHVLDKSNLLDLSISCCQFVCTNYIPCILLLLSRSAPELQSETLKRIRSLTKSFHNKQVLCQIQFSKILMQLFDDLNPSVHEICYSILKNLISYSISPEEAGLLMDALGSAQIQQLVKETLALDLQSNFYNLENQCLDTPTITAFSKNGYSLMFWVKIPYVSTELTPIFSWVDHNRGLVLFKLSTVRVADKKLTGVDYLKGSIIQENNHFLTVQAPTQPVFPSPDETAKFPVGNFYEWTHISIVHSKLGVTLYVNSNQLPLVKCTHFGNIREKYNVTGVFGSKTCKIMLSDVVYVEGSLESNAIIANYEKDVVDKFIFKLPDNINNQVLASVSLEDKKWDLEQIQSGNNLHKTSPIKSVFGKVSAISQFFALMKTGMQQIALCGICECITHNTANYKYFLENGGWNLLGSIISKHEEYLTSDSLEYLISAIMNKSQFHLKLKKMLVIKSEKIPSFPQDRLEGLSILSELLTTLPGKHLSGVLDCFTKLMSLDENCKIFLSSEIGGLMIIFELFNTLVKDNCNEYLILTLFEKILPHFTQEHVEMFVDYLSSPDLKGHFVKIEKTIESVISIFCIHLFSGNSSLMDKFLNTEGNLLIFEIARCGSGVILGAAVKLMGLLLGVSAKYKAWFLKTKGFDMLNIIMQKQVPSKVLYELIINLLFNGFNNVSLLYPNDAASVKMIINLSQIAAKALPAANSSPTDKKIVFVEALEILVEMLRIETDDSLKLEVFNSIENLLDSENCEKVLESPFLVWTSNLVKESQHLPTPIKDSKNLQIFETFIVKLCIYDLNRPPNKCKFIHWINKIPDADSFREKCLLSLLNTIKSNPNFDACEGYITAKSNFIKNFYTLLQSCELTITYNDFNMKVIHLVNLLASCNTPAVRQQLKAIGFFDLRDDLIIQLLKEDLPQNVLIEGIQCFSFETIASQPKFRDSNAVVYFIKFLIEFHSAPALQLEILNLIQNDICIHEDNRKYLKKILDNKFFLDFLGSFKSEESNSISQCFRSMRNLKLDDEHEDVPENPTAEDFLAWLNASDKAKKTIMAQVNKHLAAVDSEYRKNYNKSIELKAIKRKKTIDALIKDKTTVQKQVNELELRLITRVTKAEERCTQRFQAHSAVKAQKLSTGTRQSL